MGLQNHQDTKDTKDTKDKVECLMSNDECLMPICTGHSDFVIRHSTRRVRRGITLLEVLISIFVITVGLLGVASLIPIGRYSVVEAAKADRAAACGRAAWRDASVRGYLDPVPSVVGFPIRWLNHQELQTVSWMDPDVTGGAQRLLSPLDYGNSVCIDPLLIARENDVSSTLADEWYGASFPVRLDNDPDDSTAINTPMPLPAPVFPYIGGNKQLRIPRMERITLNVAADPALVVPMSLSLAGRVFTWQDDLLFDLPDDETLRPQRVFARDTTSGDPLYGQSAGDYSWLITITPVGNEGPISPQPDAPGLYTVSVVVFYKRDLLLPEEMLAARGGAPPSERVVYADLLTSTGLGGGSVQLRLDDVNTTTDPERNDMPDVRPGQWIMLSWWTPLEIDPLALPFNYRAVFKWYRVVAAGEPIPPDPSIPRNEWTRNVTLAGPDWREEIIDESGTTVRVILDADNGDTSDTTVHATLATGVQSVFEKTMTIDTWANWASPNR